MCGFEVSIDSKLVIIVWRASKGWCCEFNLSDFYCSLVISLLKIERLFLSCLNFKHYLRRFGVIIFGSVITVESSLYT